MARPLTLAARLALYANNWMHIGRNTEALRADLQATVELLKDAEAVLDAAEQLIEGWATNGHVEGAVTLIEIRAIQRRLIETK